jgi:hydrogenase maturation protease
MTSRVLVAGIGNVFFGDDAFGVEVARKLKDAPLPSGTKVMDVGIRGVHLAFELLEPIDMLVLVDCAARGGTPGTLYLIDPEVDDWPCADGQPDAHVMNPRAVLAAVKEMGGTIPATRIVGCEPADVTEGMYLSEPVRQAIGPAVEMIQRLLQTTTGDAWTNPVSTS